MRPLIFVSGYSWSGSGAVVDFLRGSSQLYRHEGREIKNLEALRDVVNGIRRTRPRLEEAKARYLCGEIVPGSMYDTDYHRRCPDDLARALACDWDEFLEFGRQCVERLRLVAAVDGAGRASRDEQLRSICSDYMRELDDNPRRPGQLFIYDNALHADKLDFLEWLATSEFRTLAICVDRDPRDQFYELCEREKYRPEGAGRFIADLTRRRDALRRFEDTVLSRIDGTSIVSVRFEEFVLDQAIREGVRSQVEAVLSSTGGEREWSGQNERFVPEHSQQNIGKWRRAQDLTPFHRIGDAFRDLIHDPA